MATSTLPETWSKKKIGEIGEVIGGGTPPTGEKLNYSGNIAWITPKDLSGYDSVFIARGERSITKLGLRNSSARLLPPGTVLFTSRAPIGYVAIASNELSTNQGFKSIICDPKIADNKFIYYALKYYKDNIENVATGSTFKEINAANLRNFEILLPPLLEQKEISKVLFCLDEKIEIDRRQNKTLENICQEFFKRWFIDFEFPNDEAKPYKSSGGEMVDSEFGEIPRGWIVSSLDQIHDGKENCVITGPFGSNLHSSDYRESGTPLILVKHVKAGRINSRDMPLVGNHKFPEMNRYLLKIGDIVFTRVAVVGESAYIRKRNENWMISGQMLRVRANANRISPRYLAQVFLQETFKEQVGNYAVGSTRPSLNTKLLLSFKFVLPPLILQNRFCNMVEDADAKIENNLDEIDALTSIRDLLLSKLMSGKARIPLLKESVKAR